MKRKRIISAILLITMIATTFNTNVFAGGDMSIVSINCEGVFKGCCKGEQDNNSKSNKPDKEDNKGSLHYQFDKETGHLTILGSYTGLGPIAPQYANDIRSVTIERGVRRLIGTFQNCYNLTSVHISDTVREISEDTFTDCKELESITIPDSVTEIGARAFKGCTSLESVKIPASVTKIGEDAFKGCKKLKKVTISNSSTEIDENAFDDCPANIISPKPSLNPITAPSVTSPMVSYSGINDINGQTPITLPPNIVVNNPINNAIPITPNQIQVPISTSVNQNMNSSSLAKESIDDNKFDEETGHLFVGTEIESKSIEDIVSVPEEKIKSITIKDGVTSIGDLAFYGCTGLASITIPDSVTSIGYGAFSFCTGLTSITIPNSVTKIGKVAFSGCTGLTSINIPNSVTSIGEEAFCDCTDLTSINIPDSVIEIGEGAFARCTGLTSINVDARNPKYESIDGVLFTKDGTKLIQHPAGKMETNYIIPNSVTSIGEEAFNHCEGLTSINIPNSVTSIGDCAFKLCISLKQISIPSSVTYIGFGTFLSCTGLTSINIPNSVTSIGEGAFEGCTGLKEATIPKSINDYKKVFDKNTKVHRI